MSKVIISGGGAGGLDPDELTAVAADVRKGKIAGVNGSDDPVTGTLDIPAANILAGKSIGGVAGTATNDGTITAAEMASGKIAYSKGSKITGTLAAQGGSTTTPGTANKTIVTAPKRVTGNIIVAGASTLVPANIKKNVTIFGVKGTHSGYVTEATDLYNYGTIGSLSGGFNTVSDYSLESGMILGEKIMSESQTSRVYGVATKNKVNLTPYNYINVSANFLSLTGGAAYVYLGLSNNSAGSAEVGLYVLYSRVDRGATGAFTIQLNVSNYNAENYISVGTQWTYGITFQLGIYRIWLS